MTYKKKKIETKSIMPWFYFFFAGAFFSFLAGFFAIKITLGI
jgi:hypothetical protein